MRRDSTARATELTTVVCLPVSLCFSTSTINERLCFYVWSLILESGNVEPVLCYQNAKTYILPDWIVVARTEGVQEEAKRIWNIVSCVLHSMQGGRRLIVSGGTWMVRKYTLWTEDYVNSNS